MSRVQLKDPNEGEAYTLDWDDETLATGETISTSAWAIEGGDSGTGTVVIDSNSNTTTTATVVLSAGNKGQVYTLRNRITTSQSRTLDRSVTVRVEPR